MDDLALMNNLNAATNRGLPLKDIARQLSDDIGTNFGVHGAALYLLDENAEMLIAQNDSINTHMSTVIEKILGEKISSIRISMHREGWYRSCIEQGRPKLASDPATIQGLMAEFTENRKFRKLIPAIVKRMKINNVLAVPLYKNEVPVGLIDLSSKETIGDEVVSRMEGISEGIANVLSRRLAENALKAEEEKYRTLFETMVQGVYYQAADGTMTDVNSAALDIFGIDRRAFLGKDSRLSSLEFVDEKNRKLRWNDQPSVVSLRKGNIIRDKIVGVKNPRKKGLVWISVNVHPQFRQGSRKPFQVFVTLHDVTAIKKAEENLKLRNDFIETILDKMPIGLAVNTIDDGKVTYINTRFEEIYGWPTKEIADVEEFFRKVYPDPDYRKKIRDRIMADIGSGDPERMIWNDVAITRRDGSQRIVQAMNIPIYEQKLMISTVQDVTERSRAENAHRLSVTRFKELFSRMRDGVAIYAYDKEKNDFIFKDMNDAGQKITGVTLKEVRNRPVKQCFPGVRDMGLWEVFQRVYKSGESEFLPADSYKDDRLNLYLENQVFKLPTGEIVAVFSDNTERKIAEIELRKSYREIRKLSIHIERVREEERKEIAMNLHDELGQILTAIKMDLSWIRNKVSGRNREISERSEDAIRIVEDAIRGIRHISSDLRPPVLDNLGLAAALQSHLDDFAKRTKIRIWMELPEEFPELSPDLSITIFRIVQEALTNTARHSGATETGLKINEKSNILEIELSDNGSGISTDQIASTESFGLIGMKERVHARGGEFEISGVEGKGTMIRISLPLHG